MSDDAYRHGYNGNPRDNFTPNNAVEQARLNEGYRQREYEQQRARDDAARAQQAAQTAREEAARRQRDQQAWAQMFASNSPSAYPARHASVYVPSSNPSHGGEKRAKKKTSFGGLLFLALMGVAILYFIGSQADKTNQPPVSVETPSVAEVQRAAEPSSVRKAVAENIGQKQEEPERAAALPAAEATTQSATKTASHADMGERYCDLMKYDQADAEYRLAYAETGDPRMILKMALCYSESNQRSSAASYYRAYLAQAPNAPDGPAILAAIRRLESQ